MAFDPHQIAQLLPSYSAGSEVQVAQVRHRIALAEAWGIDDGMTVVEVGSGQGDMTAVLASLASHVVAIDSAPRDYGAPLTIGQSMDGLAQAFQGRIEAHFEASFLDWQTPADLCVLAHCSWYFESDEQLLATLRHARTLAPRLGFAEWDLSLQRAEQLGHLQAVLIQGRRAAQNLDANVRSPRTKARTLDLIQQAGWTVQGESQIDARHLADGKWEVGLCLTEFANEPSLALELELLRSAPVETLDAYSVLATR